MRLPVALFVPLVAFAAAGTPPAVADGGTGRLIPVDTIRANHPEMTPFIGKVRDVLVQHDRPCQTLTHVNVFPTADGVRIVAACNGPLHYEILSEAGQIKVFQK